MNPHVRSPLLHSTLAWSATVVIIACYAFACLVGFLGLMTWAVHFSRRDAEQHRRDWGYDRGGGDDQHHRHALFPRVNQEPRPERPACAGGREPHESRQEGHGELHERPQ